MSAKVSVLVPNYNHARFLPQRLDSIAAQTWRDFELIVLDDASRDDSSAVLARYAEQMPMRLLLNETNSGSPFAQWRRGVELAIGEYVWIAESDDYADPRLLEVLVAQMQKHPNVGLAYCLSQAVDEQNRNLGPWLGAIEPRDAGRWQQSFVNDGREEVARHLVKCNTIPNASAVLVKKELLREALRGTERTRLAGDWWTWARVMLQDADVAFVHEPLNFYRCHPASVRDTTKLPQVAAEEFAVLAHICSRVTVQPALRREVFHEAFYKFRRCFDLPDFRADVRWLRQVHRSARRVRSSATWRMAWFLTKQMLKRLRLVASSVRTAKRMVRPSVL